MLLNSQESCVINESNTTPYVNLGKGAPQGDPVSAYLFILALEVLFVFIKSNENIKGIEIFKFVFLYTAYADDSTFFLRDILSVKELINSFNQFYYFSGLKANIENFEIAGTSSLNGFTEAVCGLKCIDLSIDTIKTLGIYFFYKKSSNAKYPIIDVLNFVFIYLFVFIFCFFLFCFYVNFSFLTCNYLKTK